MHRFGFAAQPTASSATACETSCAFAFIDVPAWGQDHLPPGVSLGLTLTHGPAQFRRAHAEGWVSDWAVGAFSA